MYADTMYIPHDIHDVYRRHRPYCSTRTTLKVAHLGAGGAGGWGLGAGGWVLQGPMGLWCSGGCQKLYGLVRKPVAALHNAAAEPLRHASNDVLPPLLGAAMSHG